MILYFKNTAVNENVNSVEELKYVKFLKKYLNLFDFWPEDETKKTKLRFRYVILVEFTITWLLGILYLKNNIGKLTFYDLGHTYITVFMNVVSLSRLFLRCFQNYDSVGERFFKKIHLFHYKNDSKFAMQIYLHVHKISHNFTIIFSLVPIFGIITYNLAPIVNNFTASAYKNPRPENVTLQQSVYYALPFDYTHNMGWYILVAIFNVQKTFFCTSIFIIFDLLLSLMIIHLWGHLKILIYNLNSIPKSCNGSRYTPEENKMIYNSLMKCIQHHSLILSFIRMISNTYGMVILVYYSFHQVTGCLLLLQCSKLEVKAIARFGYLTIILLEQLIQISGIFELLGFMSDKLQDAVYCLPWEHMDTKHRKIVCMMLRQAQIPIKFKAMNMLSIGAPTAVSIMKTSITYFLMLRTLSGNDV